MSEILEGFDEGLDDLKAFPDKGKINALTKVVRSQCLLDNDWIAIRHVTRANDDDTLPPTHHESGLTNASRGPS